MTQVNEVAVFKYETLDVSTADVLKDCEREIEETLISAATTVGMALKRAQSHLAKKGYGCFGEWVAYLGFSRQQAYHYMNGVDLIVKNFDKREVIEALPPSLRNEVAKPSAENTPAKAQAKSEVLNGDIDTLKAYRERIAELESQAKQATEQAESARQIAEEKAQRIEQVFGEQTMYDANVTKVTNGERCLCGD